MSIHSFSSQTQIPDLYRSAECDYRTNINSDMTRQFTIHIEAKPHQCPEPDCDYSVYDASMLKSHLLVHSGDSRLECFLCGFKTTRKSTLIEHGRAHTGEKPHKCPQPNCGYTTGSRSALSRHRYTHIEERPFSCTDCNYRAKTRRNLRDHLNYHTGVNKKHTCIDCGHKTTRPSHLLKHRQRKHLDAIAASPVLFLSTNTCRRDPTQPTTFEEEIQKDHNPSDVFQILQDLV